MSTLGWRRPVPLPSATRARRRHVTSSAAGAALGCWDRSAVRPRGGRHQFTQQAELLPAQRLSKKFTPVALPPGRAKLVTNSCFTGSPVTLNTIGIVVVAAFAERRARCRRRKITLTGRRTSSAASSGSRSRRPSAHRDSIATPWPSTKPVSAGLLPDTPNSALEAGVPKLKSDHRHRLLRARRERKHRRAAEPCDEIAAFHSMISSAAAEKAIGTSMPSARAVLRLRTNSYLAACITGSSPGFSPLRMRATYTPT